MNFISRSLIVCGLLWLPLVKVQAGPIISELMASNNTTIEDEDSSYPDWIEIHNPDTTSIDLTGWHLTDDPADKTKWTFPTTSIPAGGYLVVFASDKNRALSGQELHTNFKLDAAGEYLALVEPDGTTLATEFNPFPAQQTDVSYGIPQGTQVTSTAVDVGAGLKFHVPSGPVTNWNTNGFDDTSWTPGSSGIGYERTSGYEALISTDIESASYDVNRTVYLRIPFNVTGPTKVVALNFLAKWDDGIAAYLNGQFIADNNAPDTLSWNSGSNSSQEANLSSFQSWDATSLIPHLVPGTNTLAIQMLNQSTTSSDFLIIPKLEMTTTVDPVSGQYDYFTQATPGTINNTPTGEPSGSVLISEPSGVKTTSINVTLTPPSIGAPIRYTLDGSEPTESSQLYNNTPLVISDPSRLRVRAFEAGKVGGSVAAADYSFIDSSLSTYLADVPVIVMDNFGAGSYPNKGRSADGRDIVQVPRQANVMSFFDIAGNSQPFSQAPALQSRTGCRVRGSSSSTFTRKPLSVEFWKENKDNDRNLSPFGMDEEADWVLYAPEDSLDKPLIHNPVSFGFAKMIGALAPNSKVVVVFQNTDGGKITSSDLAGVYVFMEKVERNRMGMDFKKMDDTGTSGGWMINVDRLEAIPVGLPSNTVQPNFHAAGPNGILEVADDVDGASGSQPDDISNFYHSFLNFSSPDGYSILAAQRNNVQTDVRAMDTAVWANDFDDPVTGYAAHLDADSWARAYAVHNFSRNTDSIVLSTFIYRESPTTKIKMGPVWDFDRAFTQNGSATGSPLHNSNRDWYNGLFQDLNFKQVHQDAWQEARRTTATNSALEALVDDASAGLRSDQISASGLNYSTWQSRVSDMRSWVVDRANYLDSQYEPIPTVSPATNLFSGSVQVTMSPTAGGTVYYTTDGTDPRASGGGIAPTATAYSSPVTVSQRTHIMARTKDDSSWSGIVERNYYQLSEIPQLVISEISYHPADPSLSEISQGHDDSDDFEYLEIQNIGNSNANLATLALAGGITFDFSVANITTLAPDERVLVVRNIAALEFRHGLGLPIAGEYQGALNNAGDNIILKDSPLGIDLQNFSYDDTSPWPSCSDGLGYSLILRQPTTNPDHSLASNWRCSSLPTGNPGSADDRPAFSGNPMADADGDGLSSLLEHFLGTDDADSTEGNDRYRIGLVTLESDGLTYPTFEVTYNIGADDITTGSLWSQDMQTWSEAAAEIILMSDTPIGDGTATLIWRATSPHTIAPQFFRLKITQP